MVNRPPAPSILPTDILDFCSKFSFVMTLVADAWGRDACKHMFYWEPAGALISTVLSQMILGSRVYAIFGQNKKIGLILTLTLVVEIIIGGISVSTTSPPAVTAGLPGSKPPCGAVMGPFGWLIAFWTIPLFYDLLTFLLTAWKAYEFWKREVNTPLFSIIWRDGLLYFFAIFSMNAANVIIFLTVPKSLRAINLTPTLILEVILSCRLLLNLRGASGHSASQPLRIPATGSGQKWSSDNSQAHIKPSYNLSSDTKEQKDFMELYSLNSSRVKLEPVRQPGDKRIDVKVTSNWSAV